MIRFGFTNGCIYDCVEFDNVMGLQVDGHKPCYLDLTLIDSNIDLIALEHWLYNDVIPSMTEDFNVELPKEMLCQD